MTWERRWHQGRPWVDHYAPVIAPAIGKEGVREVPKLLLLALAGRDGRRLEVVIWLPCPVPDCRLQAAGSMIVWQEHISDFSHFGILNGSSHPGTSNCEDV